MNPDINKMSIIELKALAFDIIGTINQQQQNLQIVNQKIADKQKEIPVVEEKPKEQNAKSNDGRRSVEK